MDSHRNLCFQQLQYLKCCQRDSCVHLGSIVAVFSPRMCYSGLAGWQGTGESQGSRRNTVLKSNCVTLLPQRADATQTIHRYSASFAQPNLISACRSLFEWRNVCGNVRGNDQSPSSMIKDCGNRGFGFWPRKHRDARWVDDSGQASTSLCLLVNRIDLLTLFTEIDKSWSFYRCLVTVFNNR